MKLEVCINKSFCKACGYCIGACPKKILEFAPDLNESGFHPVHCINKEKCTGCALCYQICPEIAIEVIRER